MTPGRDIALGIQLYSVKDHLGEHTERTLRRLADMGYTDVEPYAILGDIGLLRDAIAAAGLRSRTAHVHADTEDPDRVVAAAAGLGLDTVIVPSVDPARFADRDAVERLATDLGRLAVRFADSGLRLGYHNHDFEFASQIGGKAAWSVFADLLDEKVQLELDTYWASMGGADVFELLPRYAERIRFLHVKDAPPEEGDPPPEGVDITGRMDEVVQLAGSVTELVIVEIVTDQDLFGVLASNAVFFAKVLSA